MAVRRVRTPEGSKFYGLPIGSPITPDVVAKKNAMAKARGLKVPTNALTSDDAPAGSQGRSPSAPGGYKPRTDGKIGMNFSGDGGTSPAASIKVGKSSLTGDSIFTVGESTYSAPTGSKVIKSKTGAVSYLRTPEGEFHAFNASGEVTIPATMKTLLSTKFGDSFTGDAAYDVEELTEEEADGGITPPTDPASAVEGTMALDDEGNDLFVKQADGTWLSESFGLQVSDDDLKDMVDAGELTLSPPPEGDSDDAEDAPEETKSAEVPDLTTMSTDEAEQALDAMEPGTVLQVESPTPGAEPPRMTKQDDGTWLSDAPSAKALTSRSVAHVRTYLSTPKDEAPEKKVTAEKAAPKTETQDQKSAPKKAAPNLSEMEDDALAAWLDEQPAGTEIFYTNQADGSVQGLTKMDNGNWIATKAKDSGLPGSYSGAMGSLNPGLSAEKPDDSAPEPKKADQDPLKALTSASTEEETAAALDAFPVGTTLTHDDFAHDITKDESGSWGGKGGAWSARTIHMYRKGFTEVDPEPKKADPEPVTARSGAPKVADAEVITKDDAGIMASVLKAKPAGTRVQTVADGTETEFIKRSDGLQSTWEAHIDGEYAGWVASSFEVDEYLEDERSSAAVDMPDPDDDTVEDNEDPAEVPDTEQPVAPANDTPMFGMPFDAATETLDSYPTGTVLRNPVNGFVFTKNDQGQWTNPTGQPVASAQLAVFKDTLTVETIPSTPSTPLPENATEEIGPEDLADLAIGTEIWVESVSGLDPMPAVKKSDGLWSITVTPDLGPMDFSEKNLLGTSRAWKVPATDAPAAQTPAASGPSKAGDQIEKYGTLREMPFLTTINADGYVLTKGQDGKWRENGGAGTAWSPNTLADDILAGNVTLVSLPNDSTSTPTAPAAPATADVVDDGRQVSMAGATYSRLDISRAVTALESHSGFQISYGLKSVPNNPVALNQKALTDEAQKAYPTLRPKQALLAHLRKQAGLPSDATKATRAVDGGQNKIHIGAANPQAKSVQGYDGGDFTERDIRDAIDILEAFQGKAFKAELNKKGNALGILDPNTIVGFDKDKTKTKAKFIAHLKGLLPKDSKATTPTWDGQQAADAQPGDEVVTVNGSIWVKTDRGSWHARSSVSGTILQSASQPDTVVQRWLDAKDVARVDKGTPVKAPEPTTPAETQAAEEWKTRPVGQFQRGDVLIGSDGTRYYRGSVAAWYANGDVVPGNQIQQDLASGKIVDFEPLPAEGRDLDGKRTRDFATGESVIYTFRGTKTVVTKQGLDQWVDEHGLFYTDSELQGILDVGTLSVAPPPAPTAPSAKETLDAYDDGTVLETASGAQIVKVGNDTWTSNVSGGAATYTTDDIIDITDGAVTPVDKNLAPAPAPAVAPPNATDWRSRKASEFAMGDSLQFSGYNLLTRTGEDEWTFADGSTIPNALVDFQLQRAPSVRDQFIPASRDTEEVSEDLFESHQWRVFDDPKAARKAARDLQREAAFDSGEFYAVLGDRTIKAKVISEDREGFELDPSETDLFASLASNIGTSNLSQEQRDALIELTSPSSLVGKRMFVDSQGGAIVALDGDRLIGPFTYDDKDLTGNHGPAREELLRKAVRAGGRYAVTEDNAFADRLAEVGLVATHGLPDGKVVYRYDPEQVGGKYNASNVGYAADLDAALVAHEAHRAAYEKSPFHISLDQGEMGDTHIRDANGKKTKMWGLYGAAGMVVRHVDAKGVERFFMVQRSQAISGGGTWQFGGGAINSKETDLQGAAREFYEETKPPAGWLAGLTKVGEHTTTDPGTGWHYGNVAADTPTQFTPTLDYESSDARWLTRQEIADLEASGELHKPVASTIRKTLALYGGTESDVLPAATPRPQAQTIAKHASVKDPKAKQGTFSGGSNGGRDWFLPLEDGSTARYFVKPVKSKDAGRQEALASALYREVGLLAPDVDFDESDNRLYSRMIDGVSSAAITGSALDEVREGFAVDAWLGAWDVRLGDNIMLGRDGKPIRIDNGGSLEFRAQGSKKGTGGTQPFGPTVDELDTFRQSGYQAFSIYGSRGKTPDPWEITSAQRVVDLTDERITTLVTDHNLPPALATTLIARRDHIAQHYGLKPTPRATKAEKAASEAEVFAEAVETADVPQGSVAHVKPARPTHGKADTATVRPDTFDRSSLIPAKHGEVHELTLSDGTKKDFAVSTPKSAEVGKSQHLAALLYGELGVRTLDTDYDADDDKIYVGMETAGPNLGAAGYKDVQAGFVADAWLGNWNISDKSIAYAPDGTPIRADLRGTLAYRIGGQAKNTFGDKVEELDSLRSATNPTASQIFGTRDGGVSPYEWEGAQAIINLRDDRIREMVKESGLADSLADTLIARRDYIKTYYGLVDDSTPVPPRSAFADVNGAESKADAQRVVTDKAGYVRAHLDPGVSYLDFLKSSGSVEAAFADMWKQQNPGKPDRIAGQGASQTLLGTPRQVTNNSGGSIATHDVSTIKAEDVLALAKDFDLSPAAWSQAAADFKGSSSHGGQDTHIALQLIQNQRGYQESKPKVAPDEYEKLLSTTHTHLFRGDSSQANLTAIRDGNWRGGTGARAHGSGVYAATSVGTAVSYASGGSVMDMAFDHANAKIADSDQMDTYNYSYSGVKPLGARLLAAIAADKTLTTHEKKVLTSIANDKGALAALLGFDAIQGNRNSASYDFNILNKSLVAFSTETKPFSTRQVKAGGYYGNNSGPRNTDPDSMTTAGWGNGVRNKQLMADVGRTVTGATASTPAAPGAPPAAATGTLGSAAQARYPKGLNLPYNIANRAAGVHYSMYSGTGPIQRNEVFGWADLKNLTPGQRFMSYTGNQKRWYRVDANGHIVLLRTTTPVVWANKIKNGGSPGKYDTYGFIMY